MNRGGVIVAWSLLLAGCVSNGASRHPANKTSAAPHIEPLMDGLIDEQPVWDARPTVSNAQVGVDGLRRHRVVAGDTGIAIAHAYGIAWGAIVKANNLTEPFVIRVGQQLVLPSATTSSVEARALAFKIDIDDIATGGTPALTSSGPVRQPTSDRFGGRFSWPVVGSIVERFGPAGTGRVNRGIEISASRGSNIRAAADGTVAFVGNGGLAGYGGLILIRHGDGWISVYGRAAQATVARGQSVKMGQAIGSVGDEAKLHFELRQNRTAVDPAKHLPKR